MAQSLTYLLDTNIYGLLFSLHRRHLAPAGTTRGVAAFLAEDLFANGAVRLVALDPADMGRIVAVASEYHLDFDDSYQYVAAEQDDVPLVSFDDDFDGTKRGRITPLEVLETLLRQENEE